MRTAPEIRLPAYCRLRRWSVSVYTEPLQPFFSHGSRPPAGASAGAPQERRAAVAACRDSVKDGFALTRYFPPTNWFV